MNNLSGDTVTLSQLVRTEEHGLNVNRLLFAKFLVMTGRISEGDSRPQHDDPDPGHSGSCRGISCAFTNRGSPVNSPLTLGDAGEDNPSRRRG